MLRKTLRISILLLVICLAMTAGSAFAQEVVKDPTRVEFSPSEDDAQVTRYELGFFQIGATDPVQLLDLGRPVPVGGIATAPLPARPVAIGSRYVARARAYAADLVSDWSEASNEFGYTPRPTGRPAVAR